MSVLAKAEIKRRLLLNIDDPGSLVISPILNETQFDADSVDLRLGTFFLSSRRDRIDCFRVDSSDPKYYQEEKYVPFHDKHDYILGPHDSVLAVTFEYIKIPNDLCDQVITRSSFGRLFLTIATATWVHPGFRGCLTLELVNYSNFAIALKPGLAVGQLIFFKVNIDREELEDRYIRGNYIGATRPEFPKFNKEG